MKLHHMQYTLELELKSNSITCSILWAFHHFNEMSVGADLHFEFSCKQEVSLAVTTCCMEPPAWASLWSVVTTGRHMAPGGAAPGDHEPHEQQGGAVCEGQAVHAHARGVGGGQALEHHGTQGQARRDAHLTGDDAAG